MSNQGEDNNDGFGGFMMFVIGFGVPIVFFHSSHHIASLYLERTLWKPFWKRYTDKVEGRVCIRVRFVTVHDHEGGPPTMREVKHAIIDYNVNGISMQRTFFVVKSDEGGCSGFYCESKPSIGYVRLESFDDGDSLTLRLIPHLPESAFPESEWEVQQQPYPWNFYVQNFFLFALVLCWPVVMVLLMDKWEALALVNVALYVTLWFGACIVARRYAPAQIEQQETRADFTNAQTDLKFPYHLSHQHASNLQYWSFNTAINNDVTGDSSGLKFNSKERIELYNKTFDRNGNQLILEDKHIKTKAKSTTPNDDGNNVDTVENNNDVYIEIELADTEENEHINKDDDDPSIYLPVESERRLTRHDEDRIKNVRHSSTKGRSSFYTKFLKGNNNKEKQMIGGKCIICFAEFVKEDVIVWSEDPTCIHVYHKECMVNYLASNAQRELYSTLNVTKNPCPTCRQNYCTVTEEDLLKQVQEQRGQEAQFEAWYWELD
ncbi:hypothetical protein FRACYDRAFT_249430 [Fragilariopsis cylindrus CCMP1102]|uniref:RING-type domain-containing protein n=1 Tax=Fragilariopsis cylindrus CCMP1102 TaxID=635003 RepID=A0A1E7ERR7_9STRA|nr:hypothetical protein FRACYDRAFT_249430 [Fragilariopsis cylindrus CCMP1102]|eukprot:OEU08539.1 hypothetical protein FRACYDRAFT_249430 [Fragilariopsis cylindrus CCMP1102]